MKLDIEHSMIPVYNLYQ